MTGTRERKAQGGEEYSDVRESDPALTFLTHVSVCQQINIVCVHVCGLVIKITERYMLSVLTLIIFTEELKLREKLGVFSGLALHKKYKLWYFHELFTCIAPISCG